MIQKIHKICHFQHLTTLLEHTHRAELEKTVQKQYTTAEVFKHQKLFTRSFSCFLLNHHGKPLLNVAQLTEQMKQKNKTAQFIF